MNRQNGKVRKTLSILSMALPLVAIASCGTTQVTRIAEPIGPSPSLPSFLEEGRLVVHTDIRAEERPIASGYGSATQSIREPYTIFDPRGHKVRSVPGQAAELRPKPVTLPAGEYLVRAKAGNRQLVDLKAQIVPGRTTEVFLDGSWAPTDSAVRDSVVRASDGTIVGWRATAVGGGPRESETPKKTP
jgi:hypothetical protein